MDLAFSGTRANRAPTDQVGNKLPGHHIEKFRGGRDAKLIDLQQQFARQFNAVVHAIAAVEVRVGDKTFPADNSTRLFEIGAHDDFKTRLMLRAQRL